MKHASYTLGVAIGILLLFHPIKAESQIVISHPLNTKPAPVLPFKQWIPGQEIIDLQNKIVADRKEAARKAEEARVAAEAARVAQEAAKEKEALEASQSLPAKPAVQAQSYPQTDNFYKAFIYAHESGNDPTNMSANGCLGLGQACPASKLLAVCPTMDYTCEDNYFTGYAQRYNGWAGSYAFWQLNHWW